MIVVSSEKAEALIDFLRVNKEMVEEMIVLIEMLSERTDFTLEEVNRLQSILTKHKSLQYYCRKFDKK